VNRLIEFLLGDVLNVLFNGQDQVPARLGLGLDV